jgi:hypothetical protein
MSRRKNRTKTGKPFQRRPSPKTEEQERDELSLDAARVFMCATETAEDCAAECEHRCLDLAADINYRRVAHDLWRDHRGPDHPLVIAMAELIVENERYSRVLDGLFRRFDLLATQEGGHDHIGEPERYFDLVRQRLYGPQQTD